MKKLLLSAVFAAFMVVNTFAQDAGMNGSPTQEGNFLVEVNTGFGGAEGAWAHGANTGIGYTSQGDTSMLMIGGEGGYFIQDDLAVKVGLGISNDGDDTTVSYKIGGKYYVDSKYPVQADITGSTYEIGNESPLWFGLQAGYAYFVHHNVAIEPGVRFNTSLNDDFSDESVFELRVGFSMFF